MESSKKYHVKLALLLLLLASLIVLAYFAFRPGHERSSEQTNKMFSHIQVPAGRMGDFRPMVQLANSPPDIGITELETKFSFNNKAVKNCDIEFVDQPIPIDTKHLKDCAKNLNAKGPIIVAIPGYMSGHRVGWADELAYHWIQLDERASVAVVTWKGGSKGVYKNVVHRTPLVARQISIFLAYLAEAAGTTLEDPAFLGRIQLVGHLLGAHIAGFVGQDLSGQADKIVGLDPAGPIFDEMPIDQRLSKDDAKLVQVLHTNSGTMKVMHAIASAPMEAIGMVSEAMHSGKKAYNPTTSDHAVELDSWFGIDLQLGHLDYYANGGHLQPGCEDTMHICDHERAHDIYSALLYRQIQLNYLFSQEVAISASPLSFYAVSYQQFIQGGSVQTRCLQGQRASLENCGHPLDLSSPAKDILKLPITGEKLFFQTNSWQPYISDQYLLQIGLAEKISWDESCALQITFQFTDARENFVEINKQLTTADNGMLAIPFVSSKTSDAFVGSRWLADQVRNFSTQAKDRQSESIRLALPRSIRMDISASKATGVFEAVGKRISRFFGLNKPSTTCKLAMKSLTVRALVDSLEKNIVGVYVVSLSSSSNPSGRSDSFELVLQPSVNAAAVFSLESIIVGNGASRLVN